MTRLSIFEVRFLLPGEERYFRRFLRDIFGRFQEILVDFARILARRKLML